MAKINGVASAKLASSGISVSQGAQLHMEELTAADVAKLAAKYKTQWPSVDALKIPYFDFEGKPTGFWRLRFLGDTREKGFAQNTEGKMLRYVQPPGPITEVYLPPIFPKGENWGLVGVDTAREILITEGELKAGAAMLRGLPPCIGLGGASNYGSREKGFPLLPMLDAMEWDGRRVTIIYDSDATQNPMVELAQYRLGELLTQRGARVHIGSLPYGEGGAKQGLDDYLLVNTPRTFTEQVLTAAQPLAEAAALHAMNTRFAFITNPGFVVNLATAQEMGPDKFTKYIHGDETYTVPVVKIGANGAGVTTLKTKRTAQEWIGWAPRRKFRCMTYAPGKPRDTEGMFNLWAGWGCAPQKGDVRPWTTLLDYLFGEEDPSFRKWAEQWLAYPVQNPGAKLYTALVMFSPTHGTGKSLMGESMQKIYGENWRKIKEADLSATHNAWAVNRQFIMGEELSSGEMRKTAIGDILKDLITQHVVAINKKYIQEYEVPDCMNYLLNTNHPDAFYIEDTDRRFAINRITRAPLPFDFYEKTYRTWIHGAFGGPSLFYHLLHLDLKGFDPRAPAPLTRAKEAMQSLGRNGLAQWVLDFKGNPTRVLPKTYKFDMVDIPTLLLLFDPMGTTRVTVQSMGREMQRQNLVAACKGTGVVLPSGRKQTMYVVRNFEKWRDARPADAQAHMAGRETAWRAVKVPKVKE